MILSVAGVTFSYNSHPVLENVSFVAQSGELLGIVGPNGSGKSTLLQVISRALTPREGSVSLGSHSVHRMSRLDLARQLAVVRQHETVAFDFSVTDVVQMGRLPRLGPFGRESQADIEATAHAMESAGVSHLAERHVQQLSGGEFQRVALARALAQDTPALLLDEPTSSLDLNHQIQVLQLLRSLARQGRTIIVTLHDLNLASQYCDQLLMLQAGQIRASGAPSDVLQPRLLGEVYGVEVDVAPHPATGKPLIFPRYD